MAITKKNLVAFVLTILLFISSVHCGATTSDHVSGFGIKKEDDHVCFNVSPCLPEQGGEKGCNAFCTRMNFKAGHCYHSELCCCYSS
ncbi:hypothetical protein CARUB_v10012352mg [Capsella rubella]|uniref:Knottin scorpion toxin-like domain-containing protein n=1 Tax=Capsella rubella TaxID=81985 RepID=R0IQ31_9BRAS|nr:putative defensin-like protein 110 [Capsella rubella]EOA39313.1 hypothetical protein CARUB_v10012352mg [Capsella rubella]